MQEQRALKRAERVKRERTEAMLSKRKRYAHLVREMFARSAMN